MEQTPAPGNNPAAGHSGDLTTLLLALWRNRYFVTVVTLVFTCGFIVVSVTQRPVLSAHVTILPKAEDSSAALLWPLASLIRDPMMPNLNTGGTYEQLYARIVISDRILDKAIAETWNHTSFAEPVDLFRIFDVSRTGQRGSARLKEILRSEVVSFTQKKTGFMILTTSVPEDGQFAADLANFLADELDYFVAGTKINKASEQHIFLSDHLVATERDLTLAEDALTDFKVANRSYASSPELMQEYGVLNREIQAQTTIWVELRKQLELAEIEKNKEATAIDILDRAEVPVVNAIKRHGIFGVVGFLCGLFVGVLILILRSQIALVRDVLRSAPAE